MAEPLLVDTHALYWYFQGAPQLGERQRRPLDRAFAESALYASVLTLFEFGEMIRLSRVRPFDVAGWFNRAGAAGLGVLALDADSAIEAGRLPGAPPRDPVDRMLIATSRVHGLMLATRDGAILEYGAAGNARTLEI